ncbi:MAG: hypothetical protein J6Q14_03165 [Oscillospiraceae bacterium]|nr:hypothetical protein [Oscillospiraceae bacterium]
MQYRMMELARGMGGWQEEQEEALLCACCAACEQLSAALREGVSVQDCADTFALAGAWLALAAMETGGTAGQAESFTAGDVSVHTGDSAPRAMTLRRQAWELMAPWVKDRRFLFYGVR